MKRTKTKLVSSIVTLLICFAMLIGSTFAWFTDSASTGVNKIQAGNLDVELYYAREADYSGSTTNWKKVDSSVKLFNPSGNALFEPGYTETVYLKVVNEGTLALDYKFSVDVVSEVGSINQDGYQFKLSDYLVFGMTESNTAPAKFANREAVWAAVGNSIANLNDFVRCSGEAMTAQKEKYFTMSVYMPTTVGNAANYDKAYNAPEISFGVTLLASQASHENDSFGNTYDADAVYPASAFVPTTDVIYPVQVTQTAEDAGTVTLEKTENTVVVVKAIVDDISVGDKLAMHVIPTNKTTGGYTLTSDQTEKTYDIEVSVNGEKQTNVPMEIFVGKGLNNVKLYHASDTTPTASTYDPQTGMLKFTAPNFSEYHVVYDAPKYVARVGSEYYSTMRAAASAMNSNNYAFVLMDEAAWNKATPVYWQTDNKSGYDATFAAALTNAYKANDGAITVVCRPGADVGTMTHGHVADDLTVFGNHAYVSGGEHDIEIDTFKFDRNTGQRSESGEYIKASPLSAQFYALDGIAAWGQRNTDTEVNLKFVDCQNMNRIYFSSAKGKINIDVFNCSFDSAKYGNKNTSIKTDSKGTWNIVDTSFKDIAVAIALTNENGEAIMRVKNCEFTNIATKANAEAANASEYASPIRVLGRAATTVNIDACKFNYATGAEKNIEDIVIGEYRGDKAANSTVKYQISNTKGTLLTVETHDANVGDIASISTKTQLDGTAVSGSNAKAIHVNTTEQLTEAINSAKEGDVILVSESLDTITIPSFSKRVTLKGDGQTKAILANDVEYNSAASLPAGAVFEGFIVECGKSNYHGFQHAGQITFKNCTLNGFLTTYGDMKFENCTFNSGLDQYAIDFYGGENFELTNCHFYGENKNVYIYQESLDDDKNVTFNSCDFHMSATNNTKSAVMLNSPAYTYNGHEYNVVINKCTIEGGMNTTAAENETLKTNYQGLYGLKHNPYVILGTVKVDGAVVYENHGNHGN